MSDHLNLTPVSFADACWFVGEHHRHHVAPRGHKFSVGVTRSGQLVGVAIVGRPVARERQDGLTLEVTRLCVAPRERNACSMLLGAAARAAFAMGYRRLGSYILVTETGTSYRAAGWRLVGEVKGRSWSTPSRPRIDRHPTMDKLLFEVTAA